MNDIITYKYKNKEISTPASEGYLTDFRRTNDWLQWLKKELEINEEDFDKEQFNIQYRSKNQPTCDKLFYTNEEGDNKWGKLHEKPSFKIFFPPIYLHPLIEDGINITHYCGWKEVLDVRKVKEWFKERKRDDRDSSVFVLYCGGCGANLQGLGKKCVYRVCDDHGDKEASDWWKDAWNKIGVGEIKEEMDWRV